MLTKLEKSNFGDAKEELPYQQKLVFGVAVNFFASVNFLEIRLFTSQTDHISGLILIA